MMPVATAEDQSDHIENIKKQIWELYRHVKITEPRFWPCLLDGPSGPVPWLEEYTILLRNSYPS